jgi:dihydroflavonol-4-reductase
MHTASPFPIASPKDENELIKPAVEGTLRALRAAKAAGVKRVILTSSVAAIYGCDLPANKKAFDETIWTDVNHPIGKVAYTKSKTLAEKAAWDFVKNEDTELQLTTINPGLVLGAPLDDNFGSSISLIERTFRGKDPLLPDLQFGIVDVKDVATMHVLAIKTEKSIGERILAASQTLSFVDFAKILKMAYPKSNVKTGKAPTLLIKFLSNFDGEIKAILPLLGRDMPLSNSKATSILGINFIPGEDSVKDSANYLLKTGVIKL